MNFRKFFAVLTILSCLGACIGCSTVEDENQTNTYYEETSEPNALERQGLAWSRILCSPVNLVGFTAAECGNIGGASVILFPLICCWTIPAGALAMTGDLLAGTVESLFWCQIKTAKYPWDSFEYEVAKPYCDFTKTLLVVALVAGAEGAAEGAANAAAENISGGSSSSSYSYSSSDSSSSSTGSKPRPRVRHSSCGGTGRCNICHGRGEVGTGTRCRGCGGSGRCAPCHGTGYAN